MKSNATHLGFRLLLPQMPPEMRNKIYSYLLEEENTSYTYHGLPFAPKTYNVGRTNITFAAVHQANTSLLALRKDRFLEAEEYFSCIVPNAVALRISIVVKGYMHETEFASWKEKMEKHLHKLRYKYPWLPKVMKHDIRIFFNAPSTTLGQIGRSGTYVISGLAKSMADLLKGHQGSTTRDVERFDIGIYVPAWMASAPYRRHIDIHGAIQVRAMIPASVEKLGPMIRTVLKPEKILQTMKIEGGKVEWVSRMVEGPFVRS